MRGETDPPEQMTNAELNQIRSMTDARLAAAEGEAGIHRDNLLLGAIQAEARRRKEVAIISKREEARKRILSKLE